MFDKGTASFTRMEDKDFGYRCALYDASGVFLGRYDIRGRQAANISRAKKLLREAAKNFNGKGQGAL